MPPASLARLVVLAALWGASFLFLRVAVPVLGPAPLIEGRVGIAALFLAAVAWAQGRRLDLRAHWRHYLAMGLLNSAVPFLLFAFAARSLPVAVMTILNATAPIFAAIAGAIALRVAPGARAMLGAVVGMLGVAVLVGFDPALATGVSALGVAASLAGACCYAIAGTWAKASSSGAEPLATAHGSMWAAALLVAPFAAATAPPALPGPGIAAAVLALGVASTGLAYLLYFRLIRDEGPMAALTVTYVIPGFGAFFGWLFLDEPLGWNTLSGLALTAAGTWLVAGRGR